MKKEYVIERQGKQMVLYEGLLDEAHSQGLCRISTTVIQLPHPDNGSVAVVAAEIETSKGTFSGIGDASPTNVGRPIIPHIIRMAETRAKARAMRDAVNIGMVSLEEMGGDDEPEPQRRRQESDSKPSKKTEQVAVHVPDLAALQEEVKAAVITVAEAEQREARDVLQLAIKNAAITTPGGWPHYTVYDLQAIKDWLAHRLNSVPV